MAVAVARESKNYPCDSCDCFPGGKSRDGTRWRIPSIEFESDVCPRQTISARTTLWLDLYGHYKNGVLPVAGGLLDQPYIYYRAMTIIDSWMQRQV